MLLANLTKREYVDLRKVGDYLYKEIFLALLWGGDYDHPQFGRWAGDQVVVVGEIGIIYPKAIRMIRDGKLNLPADILERIRKKDWWDDAPSLSRLILEEFKNITEEVVESLCPADPEENIALQMRLDRLFQITKKQRFMI